MSTVQFPDIMSERAIEKSERMIEEALEELGEWVEKYIDCGVNQIALIGLMEVYKASLSFNLLEDEEDD